MIKQSFDVVPQGLIKSGTASYQIDESNGNGYGSYDVLAGAWVFTKEVKGSGAFKIDPALLQSSKVTNGMTMQAGPVKLTVTDIQKSVATVSIVLNDSTEHVSGTAQLDLSKEYISLLEATVTGKVIGYDVTLQLQPS